MNEKPLYDNQKISTICELSSSGTHIRKSPLDPWEPVNLIAEVCHKDKIFSKKELKFLANHYNKALKIVKERVVKE